MVNQITHHDSWSAGGAYDPYMGRWSRRVAQQFLIWLDVAPDSHWLDVGCGTGALSQSILELAAPKSVRGIDRSEVFVSYAREHVRDERARFESGDAQGLPVESGSYDAVVSGLALNFIPDPTQAVADMKRALRSNGLLAAYVWDYANKMQMLRYFWDAVIALDPDAGELDEGPRFPICRPEPLRTLFSSAGLQDVQARPIDIATHFKDFDDFWSPFLGGQGPAAGYVASLSEERAGELLERLRSILPFALDGSIPLEARAWAVRGTKP